MDQDKHTEKRSMLAISIIAILWLGWFLLFRQEPPAPEKSAPQKAKETITKESKTDDSAKTPGRVILPKAAATTPASVKLSTDVYDLVLTNKGAAIESVKYRGRDIELTAKKNSYRAKGILDFAIHFDENEFLKGSPLDEALWNHTVTDNTITFSINTVIDANPVTIDKIYTFDKKNHAFALKYRIRNTGRNTVLLKNIMVSPADLLGPSLDYENSVNLPASIYYVNDEYTRSEKGGGGFLSCMSSSDERPTVKKAQGKTKWVGIMSRYFLVIMVQDKKMGTGVIQQNLDKDGFRTAMNLDAKNIEPGKEFVSSFKVYLGEKDKRQLAAIDQTLIDASDTNKLIEPIRFFVIWCLLGINNFIGNIGWSLVIFSILTKIVFMPLTMKSTESMKKMQQLTPKLNELKDKYKNNQEQFNKEMMKLYRDHKVNPLGGCLPMLLQMPFFIALYSALINSLDLWQAPFTLWMKDLSMPDTVASVFGYNLNILPILMTVTTYLMQKLSSVDTAGNQQQKMMMMMMPVMMIFIFWNMPSGLVLYWTLQNIFQIAHQVIINKFSKEAESKA